MNEYVLLKPIWHSGEGREITPIEGEQVLVAFNHLSGNAISRLINSGAIMTKPVEKSPKKDNTKQENT